MALEQHARALAERLVDAVAAKGCCEFQHDISDVYPVEIFLQLFGLPEEKQREYRELAKRHLTTITPDLAANFGMMQSIAAVLRDTIKERKANRKNDRSAERRVGKECVSKGRSRRWTSH